MAIQFAMADESEKNTADVLARIEREVANLKSALVLLGIKQCSCCEKFYPISDPGSLFAACEDTVCYACFSGWWPGRCHNLSIPSRDSIEHKLMRWLVDYHGGVVFNELSQLPSQELQDVHVVVACFECGGTGTLGGERCRHCHGNGTVWVITMNVRESSI